MPYANSKGPAQPANRCSKILAFFVRRHLLQYSLNLYADNAGTDQPAGLRMLIEVCVVRTLQNGLFARVDIIYNSNLMFTESATRGNRSLLQTKTCLENQQSD